MSLRPISERTADKESLIGCRSQQSSAKTAASAAITAATTEATTITTTARPHFHLHIIITLSSLLKDHILLFSLSILLWLRCESPVSRQRKLPPYLFSGTRRWKEGNTSATEWGHWL